ncbi:MAG: hypothetical protein SVG88_10290 [Halobacteriales archaeon]|nr:hypothetical protein [Halobacteriales archaeon]
MSAENTSWGRVGRFIALVVLVSAVFLTTFSLVFKGRVLFVLAIAVVAIGLISMVLGFMLFALRHFDEIDSTYPEREVNRPEIELPATTTQPTTATDNEQAAEDTTPTQEIQPVPPLINFDDELAELEEYFDDEPPRQYRTFRDEYERLKTTRRNRESIVSSLRSSLNSLSVLVDGDEEAEAIVEDIGDRLFQYIKAEPVDYIEISDVGFFLDGQQYPIPDLQSEKVRIKATINNTGEKSNVVVVLRFLSKDGVQVRETSLPVGTVEPNGVKQLNTRVYVPSIATSYEILATIPETPRAFLDL